MKEGYRISDDWPAFINLQKYELLHFQPEREVLIVGNMDGEEGQAAMQEEYQAFLKEYYEKKAVKETMIEGSSAAARRINTKGVFPAQGNLKNTVIPTKMIPKVKYSKLIPKVKMDWGTGITTLTQPDKELSEGEVALPTQLLKVFGLEGDELSKYDQLLAKHGVKRRK
ncbi:MAG: hypothetical protein JRC86_13220 [Deltaproteobacteria bacterium]|nr:hypothetical protein [Deltaproteobacteria bacterium]